MELLRSRPEQYPLLLELRELPEYPAAAIASNREADFRKARGRCDGLPANPHSTTPAAHAGETVEIAGWLYNLRKSGKIVFPLLRDGTGIMQCVAVKANLAEALFETLKNLTQESSLILRGKIRAEQRAPGGYEMDVEGAEVLQRVPESDPYPITPKEHGIDFLMDHRHLWLRSKRQHAILRVRARSDQGGARLFRFARLHAGGYAHLHARRLRRHHHAVRSELLRGRKGVPDAIRPALQRSRPRWRSARSIASGRLFAPRNRRRAAI